MFHALSMHLHVAPGYEAAANTHHQPYRLAECRAAWAGPSAMHFFLGVEGQRLGKQDKQRRQEQRKPEPCAEIQRHHETGVYRVDTKRQPGGEAAHIDSATPEQPAPTPKDQALPRPATQLTHTH